MFSMAFQRVGTISYKYVIEVDIYKRCVNLFLQHIVTRIMFMKRLSIIIGFARYPRICTWGLLKDLYLMPSRRK